MAESTAYAAPLWQDYLELTKPRVVALMILTAVIGMCMAVPGLVPWQPLVLGNLGIALCAGAAAAINHIVDERIDQQMARTQARPVATGRISQQDATLFAFVLATLGVTVLVLWVNVLTAVLTVASLIGYAFVYTMYLKRATPQNIVIGGLAGAAPPLLGWTAVTGELHGHALLLVLIIFAWTSPQRNVMPLSSTKPRFCKPRGGVTRSPLLAVPSAATRSMSPLATRYHSKDAPRIMASGMPTISSRVPLPDPVTSACRDITIPHGYWCRRPTNNGHKFELRSRNANNRTAAMANHCTA